MRSFSQKTKIYFKIMKIFIQNKKRIQKKRSPKKQAARHDHKRIKQNNKKYKYQITKIKRKWKLRLFVIEIKRDER